jgi:hypothetical protein
MDAVEGEDHHHDEVGDQQGDVKGVPAVLAVEVVDLRGVVGLPVVLEPARRGEKERKRVEVGQQEGSPRDAVMKLILRE